MSKANDHSQRDSQENISDKDQPLDMTVDLDAIASRELESEPSTSRSEGVTSIDISNISDFDQTMDLSPSMPSIESRTMDLEDPNDQTMDLSDLSNQYADGTRMVGQSMAPFQGKVFGGTSGTGSDGLPSDADVPEDGTKIIGAGQGGQDYTMDIDSAPSMGSSSSLTGGSLADDGTMLLSDSQAASKMGSQPGSQPGSSSAIEKSSYDQTMDLSESASDSRNGSEVKNLVTGNRTGQSIRTGG
nr:hypothetical protein [Pirellula sp.]